MLYYKVVSYHNRQYWSALVTNKDVRQRYYPNKWTTAPVGGLLVFTDLEKAKEFAKRSYVPDAKFFVCECKGRMFLPAVRKTPGLVTPDSRLWVWEKDNLTRHYASPKNDDPWWPWPPGTRAFKSVKLLKHA